MKLLLLGALLLGALMLSEILADSEKSDSRLPYRVEGREPTQRQRVHKRQTEDREFYVPPRIDSRPPYDVEGRVPAERQRVHKRQIEDEEPYAPPRLAEPEPPLADVVNGRRNGDGHENDNGNGNGNETGNGNGKRSLRNFVQADETEEDLSVQTRATCGATSITVPMGFSKTLKSPGYSANYDADMDCTYTLSIQDTSKYITLRVAEMDMEWNAGCANDYVEILDGSTSVVKLCGSSCSSTWMVLANTTATLVFHSDSNSVTGKWKIKFWAISIAKAVGARCKCEECYVRSNEITSGSEFIYPDFLDIPDPQQGMTFSLLWTIRASSAYVRIMFDDLGIQCNDKKIEIFENEDTTPLAEICGSVCHPGVVVKAAVAHMRLVKTTHGPLEGYFRIYYEQSIAASAGATYSQLICNCDAGEGCDSTVVNPTYGQRCTATSITVTSPNYPANYDLFDYCVVDMEVPAANYITLRVVEMDMEWNAGCANDNVEILDGSTSVVKLCGSSCSTTWMVLASTTAALVFRSNSNNVTGKWEIKFWELSTTYAAGARCQCEECYVRSKEITSGSEFIYPDFLDIPDPQRGMKFSLLWTIRAPTEYMKIMFDDLDIQCNDKKIEIFENEDTTPLAEICGSACHPGVVIKAAVAHMRMVKTVSCPLEGYFRIYYEQSIAASPGSTYSQLICNCDAGEGCDSTVVNPTYGQRCIATSSTVTSPNYPANYDLFDYCVVDIEVPSAKWIQLNFDAFDIEDSSTCAWDRLEVYGGTVEVIKDYTEYCGNETGNTYTLPYHIATLIFRSDVLQTDPGFNLAYIGVNTNSTYHCGLAYTSDPDANTPRIVGGNVVPVEGQYPWTVFLKLNENFRCGGSLIGDKWVLTAAHCVYEKDVANLEVFMGMHNRHTVGPTAQTSLVSNKTIHPNYNHGSKQRDVAILELTTPATFDNYVQPICLTDVEKADNTECVTTGWGYLQEGGPMSDELQEVRVNLVNQDDCKEDYPYPPGYTGSYVKDNMICAAAPGKDACNGDSGGPLFCEDDSVYKQYGVVSWGFGCANESYPGVYARMTNFRDFVEDTTNNEVPVYPLNANN